MKSKFACILLFSCLISYVVAQKPEMTQQVVSSCMTENGVTEQELNGLKSGEVKLEDVKDNVKCASQCIMAKLGFMNSKGVLQDDKIMDFFKDGPMQGQAEKALEACGSTTGANPCDTAFQIMVCLEKHVNELMKA
ncbi:PREDICTED: general odorant-binding protein 56h [Drosophila arizonae]|uniref:General odorant-binding protein 56h n=1 Tax=Drosophila arizonae TaxID=7263 RepID=A0ABM1PC08_DROAR|nr:PREDICTED: general odorant-binding protein 56h [Drosophila arizonae]